MPRSIDICSIFRAVARKGDLFKEGADEEAAGIELQVLKLELSRLGRPPLSIHHEKFHVGLNLKWGRLHRFETVQFELALIWSFSPKDDVQKDCKRACLSYDLLRSRDFSLLIVRQGYRRLPLRLRSDRNLD